MYQRTTLSVPIKHLDPSVATQQAVDLLVQELCTGPAADVTTVIRTALERGYRADLQVLNTLEIFLRLRGSKQDLTGGTPGEFVRDRCIFLCRRACALEFQQCSSNLEASLPSRGLWELSSAAHDGLR